MALEKLRMLLWKDRVHTRSGCGWMWMQLLKFKQRRDGRARRPRTHIARRPCVPFFQSAVRVWVGLHDIHFKKNFSRKISM